jgi:hypothetical protein
MARNTWIKNTANELVHLCKIWSGCNATEFVSAAEYTRD